MQRGLPIASVAGVPAPSLTAQCTDWFEGFESAFTTAVVASTSRETGGADRPVLAYGTGFLGGASAGSVVA